MKKKTAIILYNLGGPNNPDLVENFLFNLFYDKAIINLINPFRWLIAKLISKKRAPIAKEIYDHIGGYSPILENTIKQKEALEAKLDNVEVFVSMRCSAPFSEDVIKQISEKDFEQIILLPLYPQFSTTTTNSSINDFVSHAKYLNLPIKSICCYPTEDKFIKSHVKLIKETYDKVSDPSKIKILFSAHGLPERVIKSGDPYQWQVEQTCKSIIENLQIADLNYTICYQSRVGPMKWIEPFTDDEIIKASKENLTIIIVPVAFVSEHSETLVELDIEYKKLSQDNGATDYHRVPTLSIEENFIESLADICVKIIDLKQVNAITNYSHQKTRICPKEFCKCINNYE